jgi:hypothetical protein
MTLLWHYYWPVFAAAVLVGLAVGIFALRKPSSRHRYGLFVAGGAAVLVIAAGWHGPGGAAERMATNIERASRIALDNYEMTEVTAHLDRRPLSRTLILSGPADDFQQRQLLRIMNQVPGVHSVHWDRPLEPSRGL